MSRLGSVAIFLSIVSLSSMPAEQKDLPRSPESPASPPAVSTHSQSVDNYRQIDKNEGPEEIAAEVRRRDALDSNWEWRVAVKFFGRVVDDSGAPVAGAKVEFQWTDLSTRGMTQRETTSDESGLFSLSDVKGKRLLVRVHKDGYDSHEQNRLSFEVANPYEQNYYIPNANSPVVFRLRRRGPGVELIKHSVEVMLQGAGATAAVDLSTGKVSANGELQISAWKPWPPQPMLPHYDWKVVMKINRGGFVDAPTEFAFEAPDISYDMPVEITMRATDRDNWCVSVERTAYFAFGEPKKYGSLHLRTSANSRYVFIDYVLNPSGSRNLEQRSEHAQGAEP